MKKYSDIICGTCGKTFSRLNKEIKRNIKRGVKNQFCSRKCSIIDKNKQRGMYPEKYDRSNMFVPEGRKKDELSPFKPHMRCIKRRIKENERKASSKEILTLQDLKEIWEKQNGICPYTGWKMFLPDGVKEYDTCGHLQNKASVDRIDSNKGYEKENVEFVCMIVNIAKHSWDKETFISFCKAVADNAK